jgi:hypothetical protein
MTKQSPQIVILLLSVLIFSHCNQTFNNNFLKLQVGDPFKNTIASSEYFEFDSKQDKIIEGANGTVIVCPRGCFKNSQGELVEDNVKVELSEALSLDRMLFSNLTTTSNGKPLETDGMIYFNATANGKQLLINPDNPVHIEIPTVARKPGMMVYRGVAILYLL